MGCPCRRCPGRHACSLRNQAKPQIAVSQELKYRENVCDAGYPSAAVVLLALTLITTTLSSPAVRPWAKAIPEGCGRSCRGLPVSAVQGHRAAGQRPGVSGSRGWGAPMLPHSLTRLGMGIGTSRSTICQLQPLLC